MIINKAAQNAQMDEIVSICKHRGFIFVAGDLYNAPGGFFDYGPLGVELKNNLKNIWWRDMVHRREDIVGIDCAVLSSASIWKASGHIDGFSDPMVDCRQSKMRYRADQIFWGKLETAAGEEVCYVTVLESDSMLQEATAQALKIAKKKGIAGPFRNLELRDLSDVPPDAYDKIPSPATGEPGSLTLPAREFNLMFQTNAGALSMSSASSANGKDSNNASVMYLRPETAQGIFVNFQNVQRSSRLKVHYLCVLGFTPPGDSICPSRSRSELPKSERHFEMKSHHETSYSDRGMPFWLFIYFSSE